MSELYKLTLTEAAEKLRNREASVSEMVADCLARIETTEPDINACLTVMAEAATEEAARLDVAGPDPSKPLWGVPLTLKDVFCTKGTRTTAASRMLENYVPPYDSTVGIRLREAGAIILAKTNLDEFAMGSSTELSAFGPSKNPWDTCKVPGGSSGGAAASIAAYQTPGALGTDTGGSIRQPASLCGCVGLKPTYGRVSRYGVIAVASSFDQAGPMARRVADCAVILSAIAGPDPKDNTASLKPVDDYAAAQARPLKALKLACPKELWEAEMDPETKDALSRARQELEAAGVELKPVNIPSLKFSTAAYHILSTAEASTNLARFDGVHFGFRAAEACDLNEIYTASRSQALGPGVKKRIIMGTFALSSGQYDAYFKKSAQVRHLIRDELYAVLNNFDLICAPVSSRSAWNFGAFDEDPVAAFYLDQMTLPANLAGLPALSQPAGLTSTDKLPVGIQLIGRPFEEKSLLSGGLALENIFPPLL